MYGLKKNSSRSKKSNLVHSGPWTKHQAPCTQYPAPSTKQMSHAPNQRHFMAFYGGVRACLVRARPGVYRVINGALFMNANKPQFAIVYITYGTRHKLHTCSKRSCVCTIRYLNRIWLQTNFCISSNYIFSFIGLIYYILYNNISYTFILYTKIFIYIPSYIFFFGCIVFAGNTTYVEYFLCLI